MLWDSSQVTGGRALEEAGLDGALDRLYELTDAALGRIVAAAGEGRDADGHLPGRDGTNTSRSDLLPGMVDAVLSDGPPAQEREPRACGGCARAVPTGLRAAIARALPDGWRSSWRAAWPRGPSALRRRPSRSRASRSARSS